MAASSRSHDGSTVSTTELPADPKQVEIADTGAGMLVFVEAEKPGMELAGFADVSDWSAISQALRTRGLGVGATTHLPVFDLDELPA